MSLVDQQTASGGRVFDDAARLNAQQIGRKPFLLKHNLAENDLFRLPRLREAARAILAREESGFAKDAELSLPGWKPALAEAQKLSKAQKLEKMFDELEAGTLVSACKISALNEVDPAYDAILRAAIAQLAGDAGIRLEDITWSILTVFITAPNLLTPFHGDFEQNFLLQIQGEKDVRLYDQEDRYFLRTRSRGCAREIRWPRLFRRRSGTREPCFTSGRELAFTIR
jgi:hypothetical protein